MADAAAFLCQGSLAISNFGVSLGTAKSVMNFWSSTVFQITKISAIKGL